MSIQEGSGNVFADLGLDRPDERQAKAAIACILEAYIEERGLTQTEAAERMGLSQPDVSNIVRGRLKGFALERLFECLHALQYDVEITIRPARSDKARTRVACK